MIQLKPKYHIINRIDHWCEDDLKHIFDIFVYIDDTTEVFTSDEYDEVSKTISASDYFENPGEKTFVECFEEYAKANNLDVSNDNCKLMEYQDNLTADTIKKLPYNKKYEIVRISKNSSDVVFCGYFHDDKLTSLRPTKTEELIKTIFQTNYYEIGFKRLLNHIKNLTYYPQKTANWFWVYEKTETSNNTEPITTTRFKYIDFKQVDLVTEY